MKINVLQLGSPTGLYGAERWILALIRHLDTTRINSIVGAIKDDPALTVPLCSEACKLGIETKIFSAPGKVNFAAVKMLRQFLEEKTIHVLHTHGYKQDLIGLMATMGTSCHLISTPHGWSLDAGFKLKFYEMLNRLAFLFFDSVVPLSIDLYDNLLPLPFLKSRLKLIQNGVDTTEIDQASTTAEELIQLKQDGNFIIGYLGQLIQRKGLDILFQAVAMLDKNIKWKLVLVGDGDYKKQLEDLAEALNISDSVHFFGFKQNRLEFLKGFDVFVLSSRLEGIPRCLMESMAAGIPVIASKIPGCEELIENEVSGFLFKVDDPGDLCEKLTLFNRLDLDKKQEIKYLAQQNIYTNYSAKKMADAYEKLYSTLV